MTAPIPTTRATVSAAAYQTWDEPGTSVIENGQTIYVINYGESLSAIAQRYGVKLDELMRINHINDARSISPGQRLIIPSAAATAPTNGTRNLWFEGVAADIDPTSVHIRSLDSPDALQVLEYMSSHDAPCFYYHCANIAIQEDPVPPTSSKSGGHISPSTRICSQRASPGRM